MTYAPVRATFQGEFIALIAMLFATTVPAIVPLMGQRVIPLAGWKATFLVYLAFAALTMAWLGLRQPETLPIAFRRPLSGAALWSATKDVLRIRPFLLSIAGQGAWRCSAPGRLG